MAESREMPLEPAIEPDIGIFRRDGEGLDAAHRRMLAVHEPAIHPLRRAGKADQRQRPAMPDIPAADEDPCAGDPDGSGARRMA